MKKDKEISRTYRLYNLIKKVGLKEYLLLLYQKKEADKKDVVSTEIIRIINELKGKNIKKLRFEIPYKYLKSKIFPLKEKINNIALANINILNKLGLSLNVVSCSLGLGDQILAATACRNIKRAYPKLKVNCFVVHTDLIKNDPSIDKVNNKLKKYYNKDYPLPYLVVGYEQKKEMESNLNNFLEQRLKKIKIKDINYESKIYLSKKEISWAKNKLRKIKKPIISINTKGNQMTKQWSKEKWQKLADLLKKNYSIIQLGNKKEEKLNEVISFAGKLSPRQSIAILSQAKAHIGMVSFLMHAANGVNVPSVIIYGGSEHPSQTGYKDNINIYKKTKCSPCWLFYEDCPNKLKCMKSITSKLVNKKFEELINKTKAFL